MQFKIFLIVLKREIKNRWFCVVNSLIVSIKLIQTPITDEDIKLEIITSKIIEPTAQVLLVNAKPTSC